jgi:hypothetical protein
VPQPKRSLPQDPIPLKKASPEFKQAVTSLTRAGLDAKLAGELVDVVNEFGSVAQRPKLFPWGQFNPDGLEIRTVFGSDSLESLRTVLTHPRVVSIEFFPWGIINPDLFGANIRIR